MIDPDEGEQLFNRLRLLKFPSLAPVRTRSGANFSASYYRTEIVAILNAKPGQEPEISHEIMEQQHRELYEAVEDMFSRLTEEEQWIYHMLVDIGLSMRFIAKVLNLPKTTFARRRDALADKMRCILLEHQVVRDKLGF